MNCIKIMISFIKKLRNYSARLYKNLKVADNFGFWCLGA
jgi:hypothetical protein